MNTLPATRLWSRLWEAVFAGFMMASQVACAGYEPPSTPIPSAPPAMIRTQAVQSSSAIPTVAPESIPTLHGVTALAVQPNKVPPASELREWIRRLRQRGISMVLLEIGTSPGSRPIVPQDDRPGAGIYFRSQWAETVRDVFGELIPLAHQEGLSVFASVSPRRMHWVDPTLGWGDRSYDAGHRQIRLSPYLDVFHPAFQEYLVGLFTDLVDTGIDGILFQNDAPLGPYDGFSAFALRAFERDFQARLDPASLFSAGTPAGQRALSSGTTSPQYPPEFWRWTGWKARERVKMFERLTRAMRLHRPNLQFALEIHPEAITDPRTALVRYTEDVLEAKRRFQYFVLRTTPGAITTVNGSQTALLVEQMKGLVGAAHHIWITMPVSVESGGMAGTSATDRVELGKDIGLIYQGN